MQRPPGGPYYAHPQPLPGRFNLPRGIRTRRSRRLLHLHDQHRLNQHHARNHLRRGTLTGTLNLSNPSTPAIDLTSITGAGQGYSFTGVVPLGANTSVAYDNLVFTDPTASHVDALGDLLTLTSPIGTSLAHVYNNGTYHVDIFDPNDSVDITPFAIDSFILTPTPSAVPEPSSSLLLATGILTLAVAAAIRNFVPRFQKSPS